MAATPYERLRENATEVVSMLVTGIWLAAMFTGQDWWLAALLFGYVVVVPVVSLLFGVEEDENEWWDDRADDLSVDDAATDDADEQRDALETLRDRYARGELTDEQFERKLERLLDTETLEDVEDRARAREEETETESFERSS
ncbi:SHOCT domain-containing protein [Halorussus gelatinilyticus]|uniref:SHOCT domain-containing protein n=1 Tax=Halorussus gelatinilyticus TaxID=2937524 RepID=A0A8U0ILG4_9EURY|nr:SHOCT domain-containing protein [Halorussus gelatinilyticus]UPW01970.1 SHOCT domain-containing protein [Halorussus gelatinilyticus]